MLGVANMSCILRHRGVQLILAYSWARLAILAAGKGRGNCFYISSVSSLLFLFLFSVPVFYLLYYFFYLFSLSLGDDTKWHTRVDMSTQSDFFLFFRKNESWHFMLIICQADQLHEMLRSVFSEVLKKMKKIRLSSAKNFAWCFNG